MPDPPVVVTFDLFSALLDSRTGATAVLDRLAADRRWPHDGSAVYDDWDRRNKAAQLYCRAWVPYPDLAGAALAQTYAELGLDGDVSADLEKLFDSLPHWPLWPDVDEGLAQLRRHYRLGLLSNVDDELFGRTRAARAVDPDLVMTSQRLHAYKPDPRIYTRAQQALGPMVHVATSARDVRGALEAGIPVVRLRRPGHGLDAAGPEPAFQAAHLSDLAGLLPLALRRPDR